MTTAPSEAGRARWAAVRSLLSNWQGVVGLVLVIGFFASALFASSIAPYDPNALDIPAEQVRVFVSELLDEFGLDHGGSPCH